MSSPRASLLARCGRTWVLLFCSCCYPARRRRSRRSGSTRSGRATACGAVAERYLSSADYLPRLQALNHISRPGAASSPATRLRIPVALAQGAAGAGRGPARAQRSDRGPGGDRPPRAAHGRHAARRRRSRPYRRRQQRFAALRRRRPAGHAGRERPHSRSHQQLRPRRSSSTAGCGCRMAGSTSAPQAAARGSTSRRRPGCRRCAAPSSASAWPAREGVMRTEVVEGVVAVEAQGRGARHRRRLRHADRGRPAAGAAGAPAAAARHRAIPTYLDHVPIAFSIPPLPGAVAYRLQIAPDPSFDALLFDVVVPTPDFHGPAAPGRHLHLARARDRRPRPRGARREQEPDPQRPSRAPRGGLTPEDGATTPERRPTFRWRPTEGGQRATTSSSPTIPSSTTP